MAIMPYISSSVLGLFFHNVAISLRTEESLTLAIFPRAKTMAVVPDFCIPMPNAQGQLLSGGNGLNVRVVSFIFVGIGRSWLSSNGARETNGMAGVAVIFAMLLDDILVDFFFFSRVSFGGPAFLSTTGGIALALLLLVDAAAASDEIFVFQTSPVRTNMDALKGTDFLVFIEVSSTRPGIHACSVTTPVHANTNTTPPRPSSLANGPFSIIFFVSAVPFGEPCLPVSKKLSS